MDDFDGTDFSYTVNGKNFALTQQPYYADGTNYIHSGGVDYPQYTATCVDEQGNDFRMYWDVLNHWLDEEGRDNGECELEEDMCNWDKPADVEEI